MSDCREDLRSIVGRERVGSFTSSLFGAEIPLAQPSDEAELVELLRFASRASKKILPIGFGSKLGWSPAPEHVDFALSTRGLSGVVAYEPEDGTLTARAGGTIADIAGVARGGGNHFTPDVAHPTSATLGGVLAAGQSGIDRTRFGPVRHHVLGMRVALADGRIARSGGRLVKNVTGFDLHRLHCGAHGTLGIIVECSLRLFPGPESQALVRSTMPSAAEALRAARSIANSGVRAYAVVLESSGSAVREWTSSVSLAGRREPVDGELAAVQRILPAATVERDERARDSLRTLRDRSPSASGEPSLHAGVLPSKLDDAIDLLESTARSLELGLSLAIQPAIACIDASPVKLGARGESIAVPSPAWLALVRALRDAKLDVHVRNAPLEVARAIDPIGDLGPGVEWMRRLKRALDPAGLFPSRGFQVGP
jgi:glycolate oxidase FAD binding subunit